MKQAVFSASVLILVIIALRYAFRGKVPRRLQYALWGLVLLRLCLPFPLFESRLSVMGAVPDTGVADREVYVFPISSYSVAQSDTHILVESNGLVQDGNSFGYSVLSEDGKTVTRYANKMRVGKIAVCIWRGGVLLAGLWFAGVNLRFARRLRRTRRPYQVENSPLRVYVSDATRSPCLFGLIRPAVYLTPQAAASPDAAACVLAHELTHYRHGDHLWSFARVACLAAYWWNPLVWIAAFLSQKDSELACDEAAVRAMDQPERLAYGRVLVDMIPRRGRGGFACSATCMSSNGRGMKERINNIVKRPKTVLPALITLLIAAAVAIGCTFSGAAAREEEAAYTLTEFSYGAVQGEPIELYGESAELVKTIIEQADMMSAAWDGVDIDAQIGCYRIWVGHPDGTTEEYYVWRNEENGVLPEGKAVLQRGKHGQYSAISDDLYWKLEKIGHPNMTEREAMDALFESVQSDGDNVFFTIPQGWGNTAQWNLHIAGRVAYGDGFSRSVHLLEDINAGRAWQASKTYEVAVPEGCEELTLTAWLDEEERSCDILQVREAARMDAALRAAALAHVNSAEDVDFIAESHVLLEQLQSGSRVTVYAVELTMQVRVGAGTVETVGISHMPVAVTLQRGADGKYTPVEYWQPREGSQYEPSVREHFPEEIVNAALDTQAYLDAQRKECWAQVMEYQNVKVEGDAIEALLDIITEEPSAASDPEYYISRHQNEYDEILLYGDTALWHFYKEFLEGGHTDLRGAVMMSAARRLLGDEDIKLAASDGQEWFDAFLQHNRRILEQNSADFLREQRPKSYLLLQVAGDLNGTTDAEP